MHGQQNIKEKKTIISFLILDIKQSASLYILTANCYFRISRPAGIMDDSVSCTLVLMCEI